MGCGEGAIFPRFIRGLRVVSSRSLSGSLISLHCDQSDALVRGIADEATTA